MTRIDPAASECAGPRPHHPLLHHLRWQLSHAAVVLVGCIPAPVRHLVGQTQGTLILERGTGGSGVEALATLIGKVNWRWSQ